MRRFWLISVVIPVLALTAASVVSLPKKLIYNASASAPVGFYWLDNNDIERGDYVLVNVPDRVRGLVERRGYLPPKVPLLKRVAGLDGDRICRRGQEIFVNDRLAATANEYDGLGREMPDWHGCYILTERSIFLLQDHPQSFDGRYFGPVERRFIIGRATPLHLP